MRLLIILIILASNYLLSSAQESMRAFIGLNISNTKYHLIDNISGIDSSALRGGNYLLPNFGIDLDFKLANKLYTGIGFGVSAMGSKNYLKGVQNIPGINIDSNLRIGYLRFPLVLKYELVRNVRIIAGYSLNYSFRKNINFYNYQPGENEFKNIYNKFHHALLFGASFDYNNFRLEVNYHHGISNIWDTKDLNTNQRSFLTLTGLQFTIGYLIKDKGI